MLNSEVLFFCPIGETEWGFAPLSRIRYNHRSSAENWHFRITYRSKTNSRKRNARSSTAPTPQARRKKKILPWFSISSAPFGWRSGSNSPQLRPSATETRSSFCQSNAPGGCPIVPGEPGDARRSGAFGAGRDETQGCSEGPAPAVAGLPGGGARLCGHVWFGLGYTAGAAGKWRRSQLERRKTARGAFAPACPTKTRSGSGCPV